MQTTTEPVKKSFKDLGIVVEEIGFKGKKIEMYKVLGQEITVHKSLIKDSKFPEKGNGKCLHLQIEVDNELRVLFSGSGFLMQTVSMLPDDAYPFTTRIIKEVDTFKFS